MQPSQAQRTDFSIAGFATLNGGTTGGEGGTEVIVTSYSDLKKYAENQSTAYIIKVNGTITGTGSVASGNYQGSIYVGSNKSIVGMDSSAFLDGVGLTLDGGSNIIIQNIRMSFISIAEAVPEGSGDIPGIYSELGDEGRAQILVNGGDLISIRNTSRNIWIDHCELYSEDPAVQTNKDLYDGFAGIIDNKEVDCYPRSPYPGNCTATIDYQYDNVLHTNVDEVKSIVIRYAGVEGMNATPLGFAPDIYMSGISVCYDPANNMLRINSSLPEEVEVEVFDILGRVIRRVTVMDQDDIILSRPGKGLHLVKLSSGENSTVRKFIIE